MFSKTSKAEAAVLNPSAAPQRKGIPSVISGDMHILGNLVSEGLIDVDGAIDGNVKGDQVTVRAKGKIKGDIVADIVHVYGEVYGLIRAHSVHLYSSCHVEGVIMHESLTVEDGAFIDGKFKRQANAAAADAPEEAFDEDGGIIEEKPSYAAGLRLIG